MKRFATALAVVLALAGAAAAAGEAEDVSQAVTAAESWLALTDTGKFGESWDRAAAIFQKAITRAKWEQALGGVRMPLGTLKTRGVMAGTAAPKLVRLPTGDAVVIQFASSFENFPAAVETVSPMREQDGSWKVSGYYVKPAVSVVPSSADANQPKRTGTAWPSDADIRETLRTRIDVAKKGVGIVVGLVDDKGTRVISYGKMRNKGDQMVDGDSVFEIGSITKTFTALLLADMAEKGEVKLDDPISKFLPATVKAHKVNGKEITLLNLTRHTSGLPRMPDNFAPKDPDNPYADYTVKDMYAFLNAYKSTREIGAYHEYSNFGVGLLGHVLALRVGTDYESLLRVRVLQPLQMTSTSITLTPEMKSHLATGHWDRLPVANWDIPTLAGAGALRSTAGDMLKYVAANLGLKQTPLLFAMQKTHEAAVVSQLTQLEMGLGWFIRKYAETEIVTHEGGTGGYRAFVGMDKKSRRGVVVLANSNATEVGNIGGHLLDNGFAPAKVLPAPVFKAIKLDVSVFDTYVGTYQLTESKVVFSREGERFFAQATGAPRVEIFADTATHFFADDIDVEATFVKAEKGTIQLVLRRDGLDHQAQKIK